ncbi:hypothetical protein I2706_004164 [Vibrio alginolyticus]|uniref:hypothetical protein n=1 Tax=Vibrio alginolyticus TaxID=663 RepID=UPI0006A5C886|nr:hypothetical protein [Vibrio alginolyticus]EHK5086736.1 hypothetical protein [Vibrio alginolyticus]KOF30742.1 hypothetical protein ACX09_13845 [Vibrio alginolyticus]
MKPKARSTLLSLLILLTGCASTSTPIQYDNSHSRAHNIAHAGGLYQTEDKVIPMKDFEAFKLAKAAVGNTLLLTPSVGAGLELSEGLSLGLLTSLLEQPDTASRNSIIAWMPIQEATSARDAQQKLLYHFNAAIETVLQEQSINYERTNGNSEQKIEFYFHSADYQCPKYQAGMTNQDLCYITAEVFEPRRTMSPSFVNDGQESFAFESNHNVYYQRFRISPGKNSDIPSDELYAAISNKLPDWIFIYIAKGKIHFGKETIIAPYLLESGKPLLFVVSEEKDSES